MASGNLFWDYFCIFFSGNYSLHCSSSWYCILWKYRHKHTAKIQLGNGWLFEFIVQRIGFENHTNIWRYRWWFGSGFNARIRKRKCTVLSKQWYNWCTEFRFTKRSHHKSFRIHYQYWTICSTRSIYGDISQNICLMVFVFGYCYNRNYLALQMCLLYCCNAIIYNVCFILNNNNSAFTLKTQTACIYATLIVKLVLGISLIK